MVHLYLGVAVLGTYLYFGLATLGTYLYLGLAAPGMYLYRAGISSYTYKSMAGMGLAALGSEKYIGQRPGHKQVLRCTPLDMKMYPG